MNPTGVNLMSFLGSNGNDCSYLHMGFICSLKAAGKQCSHKDLGLDSQETICAPSVSRSDSVNSAQLNPVMFQARALERVLELRVRKHKLNGMTSVRAPSIS